MTNADSATRSQASSAPRVLSFLSPVASAAATPARHPTAVAALDSGVHAKAIQLAASTLETCAAAGVGNPTVAMSATHLVATLLWQSMRWSPSAPRDERADRLVLSDGVFSPLVYAACADLGVPAFVDGAWRPLGSSDLARLGAADGPIPLSPAPETVALLEHAVGAHGAGLSAAVGLALADRLAGRERRVFALVSEAELREGQLAEAIAHAAEARLDGLVAIIMTGALAAADPASRLDGAEALERRLAVSGWNVSNVDGHAPTAIRDAIARVGQASQVGQPTAIVARCLRGWGARSLQGGAWTGRIPTGDRLKTALEELRSMRVGLATSLAGTLAPPTLPSSPTKPSSTTSTAGPAAPAIDLPDLAQAMRDGDMSARYQTGRLAPREAHALAVRALARGHPDLSLLECDARATGSSEFLLADRTLAARCHEFRSAEAHMVSAAAAMALAGRRVFAAASARALSRATEPIELAARSGAALRLIATDAGLGAIAAGSAATATTDVAIFRAFAAQRDAAGNPAGYLLQPSDAFAAYALTLAAAEHEGLTMLRMPHGELEFLYGPDAVFNLGRFEVLVEGSDLLIVTAGAMVHEVNRALDGLDKAGIDPTVVDLYSIPFDEAALLELANHNGGRILVVEDNAGAPLAGAVSEACTAAGDAFVVESMCVRTPVISARTFAEALEHAGLSARHVVERAVRMTSAGQGSV